jgi:hypothetical protein
VRACAWCGRPMRAAARRDAKYCRTLCRQSAWRYQLPAPAARPSSSQARRFAYADPPYPGMAGIYRDHPDYAGEVDHAALVARLLEEFPDGWALSTSAAAVRDVLASCPPGTRLAAWVRGERATRHWRPLNAWEPVIYYRGRPYLSGPAVRRTDVLVHGVGARTSDPRRVTGAKPAAFCYWLFDLLGALPGDELVDLFPGSGGVTRAWQIYASRGSGRLISSLGDPSSVAGARVSGTCGACERPMDATERLCTQCLGELGAEAWLAGGARVPA